MKKKYDIVYLTNTPSFYKLNLFDEIARRGKKVLLVFYGYGSEAVNTEIKDGDNLAFDSFFLHEGDSAKRNKVKVFAKLIKLMRGIEARRVLFAGWLAPEYNLYAFLSSKKRNAAVIESGYESEGNGIRGFIKRLITRRMSVALPIGVPHVELLERLKFNGKIVVTGGVGLMQQPGRPSDLPHCPTDDNTLKYLYVGRLIDCKNLRFLIECFNDNGKSLSIVGKGELDADLKSIAKSNIQFIGFVENSRLGEIYRRHDVFILPSKSETWGLVVEEALYWGLPVMVSDRVGSNVDLVEKPVTGVIFRHDDKHDFSEKLYDIERNYCKFAQSVANLDFVERSRRQIESYISILG